MRLPLIYSIVILVAGIMASCKFVDAARGNGHWPDMAFGLVYVAVMIGMIVVARML